jgi:hypothetical protein
MKFKNDEAVELSRLVDLLTKKREEIEDQEAKLKTLKEQEAELSETAIPELMKTMDLASFKTNTGFTVAWKEDLKVSIPEKKQAAAFAFLRKMKADHIIKSIASVPLESKEMTKFATTFKKNFPELYRSLELEQKVHPQTLKATIKDLREKGITIPDQAFNLYVYNKTTIKGDKHEPKESY